MIQQIDSIAQRGYQQVAQLQARVLLAGQEEEKAAEDRRAKQGERDTGFGGLTWIPWASSYAPPYRLYGVF